MVLMGTTYYVKGFGAAQLPNVPVFSDLQYVLSFSYLSHLKVGHGPGKMVVRKTKVIEFTVAMNELLCLKNAGA